MQPIKGPLWPASGLQLTGWTVLGQSESHTRPKCHSLAVTGFMMYEIRHLKKTKLWSEICQQTIVSQTEHCLLTEKGKLNHQALWGNVTVTSCESGCMTVCFTLSNYTATTNNRTEWMFNSKSHNHGSVLCMFTTKQGLLHMHLL
jgi:hypothetical protein